MPYIDNRKKTETKMNDGFNSRRYIPTIISLSVITLLLYFYYNAFAPALSVMATDFGFTKEERDYKIGSRFSTVFFLFGAPMSVLITYIADRYNRKVVLALIAALCHSTALIVQITSSYYPILIWRGLSGALVTSCLPIYLSILGDAFPPSIRSAASVISSTVVGFGMLAGQTVSGFLCSRYGWRYFFKVTSLAGLLSLVPLFFVSLPQRGEADGLSLRGGDPREYLQQQNSLRLNVGDVIRLTSVYSNILLFLQGLPGSIPWGVYSSYLHDILANEKGFTADAASSLFIFFGVGGAIGNALSGVICRYMYIYNKAFLPVVIAIGYLISMPLLSVLFSSRLTEGITYSWSFTLHAIILTLLGTLLNVSGPALKVILLNVNRPQCRGTTMAVGEVFNNMGRIVGPIVFTYMLGTRDRVAATLATSSFFYLSAALSFMLRFTIIHDEESVQEFIDNIKLSPIDSQSDLSKDTRSVEMEESKGSLVENIPLLHSN